MADRTRILNVIVIGGSLAGLFNATVLKRLGHRVRILERTPTALLHNQGAGIIFGGPAQEFFRKYDRTKSSLALTSSTRQYLNKAGDVIDSEDQEQQMTSWDLLYNVLRRGFDGGGEEGYFSHLHNNETERPDVAEIDDGVGEYLYGHKVTSLKDVGSDGVEVGFEDKDGKGSSLKADMVIGADGPSSTVRKMLMPDVERKYAGYVAWRGTVLEEDVEEGTRECFAEKFTFYHSEGLQILAYLIPGLNGTLVPGQRLLNYVWYQNYPASSQSYQDLMTDSTGTHHRYTLPAGHISPKIWAAQQEHAQNSLPPQFSEIVQRTKEPFVQVITDVITSKSVFLNGKVLLVGDAVAGFRPHTAASTSQAALHALLLEDYMTGLMELDEWERSTEEWAHWMSGRGIQMGDRSQFGTHPLAADDDDM